MQQINARTSGLKPTAAPGAGSQMGKAAHIAGSPLVRKSASLAVPVKREGRLLVAVPRASYSASNYGPVGGDARIKVVGVGGGGGNAVNRMITSGLQVREEVCAPRQLPVQAQSPTRHPVILTPRSLFKRRALSSGPSTPTPRPWRATRR